MGQQRVSNIALIKIERAYANSVVNNDMIWIVSLISSAVKTAKRAISFNVTCFMSLPYDIYM